MAYALSAIAIMVAINTEMRANAVRPYNVLTGKFFISTSLSMDNCLIFLSVLCGSRAFYRMDVSGNVGAGGSSFAIYIEKIGQKIRYIFNRMLLQNQAGCDHHVLLALQRM